jgi:Protein of unknown function (DUF559)
VLDLFLDAGLERPDVNVALRVGGRRVIPDFRWPDRRLVVEADGAAWHDNEIARAEDAERQALLEAQGERVVRVTGSRPLRSLTRRSFECERQARLCARRAGAARRRRLDPPRRVASYTASSRVIRHSTGLGTSKRPLRVYESGRDD